MLPILLSMLPEHTTYIEPFFGGGALFWAKEPVKVEVINDFNANVCNFYEVLKTNFTELQEMVECFSCLLYTVYIYESGQSLGILVYHKCGVFQSDRQLSL